MLYAPLAHSGEYRSGYDRLGPKESRCCDSYVSRTGVGENRADNKTIMHAHEYPPSHLPRVALDSEGSFVHMGDGEVKPTQRLHERQVLLNDQVCPLASKHGVFLERSIGTHETASISSTGKMNIKNHGYGGNTREKEMHHSFTKKIHRSKGYPTQHETNTLFIDDDVAPRFLRLQVMANIW